MREYFDKNLPPGMNPSEERKFVKIGLVLSALLGGLDLIQYFTELSNLYRYREGKRWLDESMTMPDFAEFLYVFRLGFQFLQCVCWALSYITTYIITEEVKVFI